jgi:hypothetical protein
MLLWPRRRVVAGGLVNVAAAQETSPSSQSFAGSWEFPRIQDRYLRQLRIERYEVVYKHLVNPRRQRHCKTHGRLDRQAEGGAEQTLDRSFQRCVGLNYGMQVATAPWTRRDAAQDRAISCVGPASALKIMIVEPPLSSATTHHRCLRR